MNLPLQLACNTSVYGVEAVISHVIKLKLIAYTLHTLIYSEKLLTDGEESLLIIFWIKKFYQVLHGRKVTIIMDHIPLLAILESKAKLPTLAASRFQRWVICLTPYNYEFVFRLTPKHNSVNGLSPLSLKESDEDVHDDATIFNLKLTVITSCISISNANSKHQLYSPGRQHYCWHYD